MTGIYRGPHRGPILDHEESNGWPVNVAYRLAVGALRLAAPVLSRGSSKLARGFAGRRHAHELLEAWGVAVRDPDRPVVWFHAPSVGEGLQAEAVIQALRRACPEAQFVYTFFSPSAEELAERLDVDVATYLPWDLQSVSDRVLDALSPSVIVFTKTEVWPVLVDAARRRRVPVAIVGAAVPDGAGRMSPLARRFLRPTWQRLSAACANDEEDARRLVDLGVPEAAVSVTGDPGVDSALARYAAHNLEAPWLSPLRSEAGVTLVAGSTWPSDHAALLPAMRSVRAEHPGTLLVVAPHEPTLDAVRSLRAQLDADGWSAATLSEVESSGTLGVAAGMANAVVVDRVGVLATLYSVADVSYVGGGFHDKGLHSVLEPAAAACPVVFGPIHANSRAATDLVAVDGAKIAPMSVELGRIITDLFRARADRERIGGNARGYVDTHRGASDRCAARLAELIDSPAVPTTPEKT